MDGGFFGGFMPPIGDVKISPFAIRAMFMRRAPQITIRTGQGASFSNVRLLSWVLNPAPPGKSNNSNSYFRKSSAYHTLANLTYLTLTELTLS